MPLRLHPDTAIMAARGVRIALREAGLSPIKVTVELSDSNFRRLQMATSTMKLDRWSAYDCSVDNVTFKVFSGYSDK
jgi:hypothetical protein